MDDAVKEKVLSMFGGVSDIIESIPPRKRGIIDEIEIVFVDIVNTKAKVRRTLNLFELFNAIKDGSEPIGLILINWSDPEEMQSRELPGISIEEQSLLLNAFAEAQDELKEVHSEGNNED